MSRDQANKFRSFAVFANYLALVPEDGPADCGGLSAAETGREVPQEVPGVVVRVLGRWLGPRVQYVLGQRLDGRPGGTSEPQRGVAFLAGCTVKSWSNRQATLAMSCAETEYYAMVKVSAEALGIQALAADWGWAVRFRLRVDTSAASAVACWSGVDQYATWRHGSCGCKMS